MKFNIFEGARRIALLIGGIAIAGTLIALATYNPYVFVQYSIAHPNDAFVQIQEPCPSDAGRHYLSTRTSTGESVSVNLCLLAMPFGKDNTRLIPYKIDEQGMIWGAASYSSEVSDYERKLEGRFKLTSSDEEKLKEEILHRYRENWLSGLGYLVAGLAIFDGLVWAIGWIVRGFLGIPRGMDKRPE
jgi:hypothetical protein